MIMHDDVTESFDHVITPKHVTEIFYSTINQCYDDMFQVQYLSKYSHSNHVVENDTIKSDENDLDEDDLNIKTNVTSEQMFNVKDAHILSDDDNKNVKLLQQPSKKHSTAAFHIPPQPSSPATSDKKNVMPIRRFNATEKLGLLRILHIFTARSGVYEISK